MLNFAYILYRITNTLFQNSILKVNYHHCVSEIYIKSPCYSTHKRKSLPFSSRVQTMCTNFTVDIIRIVSNNGKGSHDSQRSKLPLNVATDWIENSSSWIADSRLIRSSSAGLIRERMSFVHFSSTSLLGEGSIMLKYWSQEEINFQAKIQKRSYIYGHLLALIDSTYQM